MKHKQQRKLVHGLGVRMFGHEHVIGALVRGAPITKQTIVLKRRNGTTAAFFETTERFR